MSVQQPVAVERIRDIIEISVLRNTPLALTCRIHGAWRNYRSRFLGMRNGQMWIAGPDATATEPVADVSLGQKVGVAFKQRHHKYVFTSAVCETTSFDLGGAAPVRGISLGWPARMHQIQRRMFHRIDVPHNRQIYVEFWEGGLVQKPAPELRAKLTYHGQLVDLSIGGFQVRLLGDTDPRFATGAPIGAAVHVGEHKAPIELDCQFRHVNADEFGTTLGMQIVGLNESQAGRIAQERLGALIRDFQQAAVTHAEPAPVRLNC